ncbi:14990_t:CDS:2, partial [Acaulospora morrowiae]
SDRSWSVLNDNLIDDDDKYRFYPSFSSEKSWSVLGSQDIDDRSPFGVSTYGYAADDENSKVHEYIRDQQQQRFAPLAPVVERLSSQPISSFPEPEFIPSLNASTKEFLENTFKYDRKSDEDFVDQMTTMQSDQIHHDDYQTSQISNNHSGSRSNRIFVWTFAMAIIAFILYYIIDDIPIG